MSAPILLGICLCWAPGEIHYGATLPHRWARSFTYYNPTLLYHTAYYRPEQTDTLSVPQRRNFHVYTALILRYIKIHTDLGFECAVVWIPQLNNPDPAISLMLIYQSWLVIWLHSLTYISEFENDRKCYWVWIYLGLGFYLLFFFYI